MTGRRRWLQSIDVDQQWARAVSVVIGLVAGAVVAWGLWRALRATFAGELFARRNHRGTLVPVGVGIILPFTLVTLAAVERTLAGLGVEQRLLRAGDLVLVTAVGLGLVGLIDDLAGDGGEKGFSGHMRALLAGRLTTGGLKLVGGGCIALLVAGRVGPGQPLHLVVDASLIALSANLANLLDRVPGRTAKMSTLLGAVLLAPSAFDAPPGVAVVVGGAVGLLLFDLREELMLGDAGANVLGGVLGVGLVLSGSFPTRIGALVVVAALNALSEVVSFSAVIDRVRPLRFLDRLGRMP